MKKAFFVWLIGLSSLFLVACGNDEDTGSSTPPITRQTLIGTWRVDKFSITINGVEFADSLATEDICALDDQLIAQDSTYTIREAGVVCPGLSANQVVDQGTYQVNDALTQLTVTDGFGNTRLQQLRNLNQNSFTTYIAETTTLLGVPIITETEINYVRQ